MAAAERPFHRLVLTNLQKRSLCLKEISGSSVLSTRLKEPISILILVSSIG